MIDLAGKEVVESITTYGAAPSQTPVTDAASNGPLPTVPAHVARRIENALTELLAVIHRDGGQYLAEHGLEKTAKDAMEKVSESRAECNRLRYEMAAQVQMVVDAEAECERLRSDIERHVRLSAEVVNTNERLRKR